MRSIVLFCGMGGTTEGMVNAGLDVRAAVDLWPIACEVHRRWHPEIPTFERRCQDVDREMAGDFELVWASPSCKPWSQANRSPRRGQLHPEYYPLPLLVAQMGWLGARWLVIENVLGLVHSKEGREEMARFGEAVKRAGLCWNYTIVRACDHGVPQLRRRAIIVVGPRLVTIPDGIGTGAIDPNGIVDASTPSRHRNRLAQSVGANRDQPWARHAVRATFGGGRDTFEYSGATRKAAQRAITANRGGTNGSDRSRIAQRSVMGPHGSTTNPRAYDSGAEHGQTYHEARTLAECAALQCLPMEPLEGLTKTAAHTLVGNAVPPPVAEWVCRTVMLADAAERGAAESYDRFLAGCVAECSCCDSCSLRPCDGVTAGGMCDQWCVCRDEDYPPDDEVDA